MLAVVVVVGSHFVVIEWGREVVTLHAPGPDGRLGDVRLWCVDDAGAVWLHSAGPDWLARFAGDGIVELERNGRRARYRAVPMPGPHPRIHALLRAKYGRADAWVRLIGPDGPDAVAVRLDALDPPLDVSRPRAD